MIEKLGRAQRGDLFTAIMKHALGQPPGKMDELTEMAFAFISAQMDRDEKKYQELCARRSEYGRKGGLASAKAKHKQASASKSKQVQHDTDTDNDTDTVTDTDNENETDNERREARPSLSYTELEKLYQEYGTRADELIADVSNWYTTHPERVFPGWSEAVAQFDRNQKRWGRTTPTSMEDILKKAFPGGEA